ncbi:hypothetical protein DJ480_22570 [Pseudomonas sp. Leaf98]|nr:hypothetical protein DJ480_22570 [Pseudomonas sp. Leaf98]
MWELACLRWRCISHHFLLVPTLRVGMPPVTLCVTTSSADAERPWLHSHAELGTIGVRWFFPPTAPTALAVLSRWTK